VASELRRAAKALVETRTESFEVHDRERDAVAARLDAALRSVTLKHSSVSSTAWRESDGAAWLDVVFAPRRHVQMLLSAVSLSLMAMIAASIWLVATRGEDDTAVFVIPLLTAFAVVFSPFLAVMLGATREGDEATLRRAIRKALQAPAQPDA
jgi:hypothetical protein